VEKGSVTVILPAGGEGKRLGYNMPKAFITLAGKTILEHTIDCFYSLEAVGRIVIAVPERMCGAAEKLALSYTKKPVIVIPGGKERLFSVYEALKHSGDCSYIAVHDAVRPLLSTDDTEKVFTACREHGAAMLVTPSDYTLKRIGPKMTVQGTEDRSAIWQAQTPQVFRADLLIRVYESAVRDRFFGTDEASLAERAGIPVKAVESSRANIKITRKEDLAYALYIMNKKKPPFRVGYGYDVHQLAEGRPLILGGVEIPFEKGLAGHSDADVLIHAVIDALLGALALGDIGSHFPDTDASYKNIDSRKLLRDVAAIVDKHGYETANIDATVVAQRPKLRSLIDKMRENIAQDLGIETDCVSVKATTSEQIGFAGREEGMSASSVALLTQKQTDSD